MPTSTIASPHRVDGIRRKPWHLDDSKVRTRTAARCAEEIAERVTTSCMPKGCGWPSRGISPGSPTWRRRSQVGDVAGQGYLGNVGSFTTRRRFIPAHKETSHELALSPMPVEVSESQGSRPMRKRNDDGFEGILFTGALT
jgi:hypothetical protein